MTFPEAFTSFMLVWWFATKFMLPVMEEYDREKHTPNWKG